MPRESMSAPPVMPDMRLSVAEGQPPNGRAPPALPAQRVTSQRQVSQPQASQRRVAHEQQQQTPSLSQPQAPEELPSTGCVTHWTKRRALTFLAGLGVGVLVPLAIASAVWGAKTFGVDNNGTNETAGFVSQSEPEPINGTILDRAKAHLQDNPANTVTGAVLFASLFFVWAHGGGTEIAWVSKAIVRSSSIDNNVATKRRSVTSEVLHQKARATGWGSVVWAFVGAIFGTAVVLAVLSSNSRDGGTLFLSMLLGAGTLGPLGANIGSQLEAAERGTLEPPRDRHWLSSIQAYSRPARCLASCCRAIASLPCWCGLFKVPGPDLNEQGKPIMVASPRMLFTWVGVVMGMGIFLGLGVVISATVSDSREVTLADLLGYVAASREDNSTSARSLDMAMAWVQRVDEQLAPHFRQLRSERNALFENDMTQILLLVLCSLIWDVFVIYYHLSTAPHPKFRMRFMRRLSIYTHICAGVAEIVISVVAFILYCDMATEADASLPLPAETCTEKEQQRSLLLVYAHVFCAVAHMVTAAYQTPQVFGMQLVMVPAYSAVVIWKAICTIRLALNPNSLWLLLQLFFVHHIYVWCRAMHVIFEQLGIFSEHRYSVSIMFAGLICGPICLGPAANIAVITVVAMVGLLKLPYKPREEQQEWLVEKRSNMLLNERYRTALQELAGGHTEGLYNLAQSADATQHTGATMTMYAPLNTGMTVASLHVALGSKVEPGQAVATLSPTAVDDNETRSASLTQERSSSQSTQQRARMIFDALDDDGDGFLQQEEVVALLLSWGIPYHEALECFRTYDVLKAKEVTFAQFYTDWEPVWRFQLTRVDEAVQHFFHFSESVASRAALKKHASLVDQRNTPRAGRGDP